MSRRPKKRRAKIQPISSNSSRLPGGNRTSFRIARVPTSMSISLQLLLLVDQALVAQHRVGLQIGMVRGSYHRAAGDIGETHAFAQHAQLVEFFGRDETIDRQVVPGRLQVLTQ